MVSAAQLAPRNGHRPIGSGAQTIQPLGATLSRLSDEARKRPLAWVRLELGRQAYGTPTEGAKRRRKERL